MIPNGFLFDPLALFLIRKRKMAYASYGVCQRRRVALRDLIYSPKPSRPRKPSLPFTLSVFAKLQICVRQAHHKFMRLGGAASPKRSQTSAVIFVREVIATKKAFRVVHFILTSSNPIMSTWSSGKPLGPNNRHKLDCRHRLDLEFPPIQPLHPPKYCLFAWINSSSTFFFSRSFCSKSAFPRFISLASIFHFVSNRHF